MCSGGWSGFYPAAVSLYVFSLPISNGKRGQDVPGKAPWGPFLSPDHWSARNTPNSIKHCADCPDSEQFAPCSVMPLFLLPGCHIAIARLDQTEAHIVQCPVLDTGQDQRNVQEPHSKQTWDNPNPKQLEIVLNSEVRGLISLPKCVSMQFLISIFMSCPFLSLPKLLVLATSSVNEFRGWMMCCVQKSLF